MVFSFSCSLNSRANLPVVREYSIASFDCCYGASIVGGTGFSTLISDYLSQCTLLLLYVPLILIRLRYHILTISLCDLRAYVLVLA